MTHSKEIFMDYFFNCELHCNRFLDIFIQKKGEEACWEHMFCILQDYVGMAGAILIGAGIVGAGLAGLFVDKTGKFEESAKTSLSFASLALIAFMLVSTL